VIRYDWRNNSVLFVHNLDEKPREVLFAVGLPGKAGNLLVNLLTEDHSRANPVLVYFICGIDAQRDIGGAARPYLHRLDSTSLLTCAACRAGACPRQSDDPVEGSDAACLQLRAVGPTGLDTGRLGCCFRSNAPGWAG